MNGFYLTSLKSKGGELACVIGGIAGREAAKPCDSHTRKKTIKSKKQSRQLCRLEANKLVRKLTYHV